MRRLATLFLAGSLVLTAPPAPRAGDHPLGPAIWFVANALGSGDYNALWSDQAQWQSAASKVDVLGLLHTWLLLGTDSQILAQTNFAQSHHMKLDFEIEAVMQANPTCPHIEGYVWPGLVVQEMAILKRLNIQIDVLNMDGPLWNGHYVVGPPCGMSVPDLVANVAANLAPILAQYPNIQIYEIEPIPGLTNQADWRETLNDFQEGLARATGRPVRGLFLDTTWDNPTWVQPLKDMRRYTQQRGMRLGWFFDGNQYARSDADWLQTAAANIEYIEGTLKVIPDDGIVASWNTYPRQNMPDTWPVGLTSLINHYFRRRTSLAVHFVGRGAHGNLTTTDDGKPLANAVVSGFVPGVDFSQPLPSTVVQGIVPPNASAALLGYRLNSECNCAGNNDVLVGPLAYQETQGGSVSQSFLFPNGDMNINGALITNETVGGTRVNRVIAPANSSLEPQWGFAVTPGASFSLTIPAATMGNDGWYGHVFLMFWTAPANGQPLPDPIIVVPSVGQRLMSSTTTGPDGSFVLPQLPRVGPSSAPVFVTYPGDDTHRPVTWTPDN